jgi:hypothetical protein
MVPNLQMLFGNFFDDPKIADKFLERYAEDNIAKIKQNNTGGIFNSVLNPLEAAMIPFKAELGDVDTSETQLLGKTQTVDGFIAGFKTFMKDNYINIAGKLGGDKVPAFAEFYPKGKTEYTNITKTKMPTIMSRLKTAATNNSAALGATLTAQLQGFKAQWETARSTQLDKKAALKTNRTDRSMARVTVEMCLLAVVRFVANKYVADVEKCSMFFNFSLLFGVHHTGKGDTPVTPAG